MTTLPFLYEDMDCLLYTSTVSIVKDEAIDTFIDQVGKAYKEKIGYAADFYVVEIGDGPQTL